MQNSEVLYRSAPMALLKPIDTKMIPPCGGGNILTVSRRIDASDSELKRQRSAFVWSLPAVLYGLAYLILKGPDTWWLLVPAASAIQAGIAGVRGFMCLRRRSRERQELKRLEEHFDMSLVKLELAALNEAAKWNQAAEQHNEAARRVFENPREKLQPLAPAQAEEMERQREMIIDRIEWLACDVERHPVRAPWWQH